MPLVAIDFETMPIEPLPEYPPKPIGLSIYVEGQEPRYLCWGHMEDNNSTEDEAKALLALYWNNSQFEHIAHNDPFDSLVASVHWGFDLEQRCVANDTMVMAFLCDPHALNYQLKPLAKKHLGMEPEEKDEVADWLKAKGYMKKAAKEIGELIYLAPGTLVGKYANGDTIRTMELFKFYKSKIEEQGMWEAYRREMTLQPIMLKNTRDGIRVDVARLTCDVKMYDDALARIDKLLFQMLGCEPFNIDSDAQLADAIDKAHPGLVWSLTKTGKRSTSKANMEKTLEGLTGKLLAVMQYRASIHTCVNTFMRPWLIQATHPKGNGRIRCQWNTTRGDSGGARTGRLSSSPNFMNIPTLSSHKFAAVLELWKEWLADEFPALPNVRSYVLPDKGEVLVSYDFCFSPDTEFLTSDGFRVFDEIDDTLKLAYWDSGNIGFERPTRRIDKLHIGELINVKGSKSCDILATPDHDMVMLPKSKDLMGAYKVKLSKAPFNRQKYAFMPQAGLYKNEEPISTEGLALIAAVQADGKITTVSTRRIVFKFSKQRKIDRLTETLKALNIEYTTKLWRYEYDSSDFTWIIFYAPEWLFKYIDINTKLFTREILTLPEAFLDELMLWDGHKPRKSYFSVQRKNVELVQELAVLRNRHSVLSFKHDPKSFNKAGYYSVCIHKLHGSFTKTQEVSRIPYNGRVVCFSMPHGTLIARRNGRPFVAGNCGQELRVLAHYEDGLLLKAYKEDPTQDLHQFAANTISNLLHIVFPRKHAKTVSFSILYGSGLTALASGLGTTYNEAAEIKAAYLEVLPGLESLITQLKARAKRNEPIRTWGGRVYYVEPPRFMEGRWRSFDYKLLNYLVQGSSADITKTAIIEYDKHRVHGRFLLTVHDQIVISVPRQYAQAESKILQHHMESIPLDAPLLADGSYGPNLHDVKDFNAETESEFLFTA